MTKTISSKFKMVAAAILNLFKVPVGLFVYHLVMLERGKKIFKFKTLIRKRRKLQQPFDLA